MTTDRLAVWLYGLQVALIDEERHKLRLNHTSEALNEYAPGTPLLSLKLPVANDRYSNGIVRPFLDGLLPEGNARRALAEEFDLRADDTFGLVRELGRDCAGALIILREDEPLPAHESVVTADPLDDNDLAALVANLRTTPLGVDQRTRMSLAGIQDKLLLTQFVDGGWGHPINSTPSTHILKPEIPEYPNTVENEAFCMRFAKYVGVPVAEVDTTNIKGRRLLVVTRYDREVDANGAITRIHQEDFCQANGLRPNQKYQDDGGPSLKNIASTLQAVDPPSLETLLKMVTVDVLIGNGDAHGKNYSLLHERSGSLRLAPAYDLVSTLLYSDQDKLAMYIDNVRRTDRVTRDRLLNEASSWGISAKRAAKLVRDVVVRAPGALKKAADQTPRVPGKLINTVHNQLKALADE